MPRASTIRINNGLRQGDALSCVLFNLAPEKVIRNAEVNARGTILLKSSQLLTYADVIDIMGRTTRDVQTAFILIDQAARDPELYINDMMYINQQHQTALVKQEE